MTERAGRATITTATAGDVLSLYLHARAGDFLRSLRLHRESGADVEEAAEAARLLRRSARRISGALHVYRPLTDTDWADPLRAELAWLTATLAREHAYAARLARLRGALHRLSGGSAAPEAAGADAPGGDGHAGGSISGVSAGASGASAATRMSRPGVTVGIDAADPASGAGSASSASSASAASSASSDQGAANASARSARSTRAARRSVSLATEPEPVPGQRGGTGVTGAGSDASGEWGHGDFHHGGAGEGAGARDGGSGSAGGMAAASPVGRRGTEHHGPSGERPDLGQRAPGGGAANGAGAVEAYDAAGLGESGRAAIRTDAGMAEPGDPAGRGAAAAAPPGPSQPGERRTAPGRGGGRGKAGSEGQTGFAAQTGFAGLRGGAGDGENEARGGGLTVGAARAGALLERQLTLARTRAHTAALQALGSSRFHAVADAVALLASEVPLDEAGASRPADKALPPLAELAHRRLVEAVEALPLGRAGHPYNADALAHGLAATAAADAPPASERQDAPWNQVRQLVRVRRYALEVLEEGRHPDGMGPTDIEPALSMRLLAAGQALERHRDASEAAAAAAAAARTPRIAPATAYALGVLHADQRIEVEAARFAFGRVWQRLVATTAP